jgi:hypothetical protein
MTNDQSTNLRTYESTKKEGIRTWQRWTLER